MSIDIYPLEKQAKGAFNNGEILENKPIGFPQDGGTLKAYSNLFYWAHAWAEVESTIGEHPHKGFEIMSFVLEGSIEHYDNQLNSWKQLDKGDVQIIRSGNGITHAEKLNQGSHMFQIWFDPNLSKTLGQKASYNDYKSSSFPVSENKGLQITHYKGENAPISMDTEGIAIEKWQLQSGEHQISLDANIIYSVYCLKDSCDINTITVSKDDFIIIKEEKSITINSNKGAMLFIIASPGIVSYKTYASSFY